MRQMISGVVAALAVVAAGIGPAKACGFTPCGQAYVPAYSGCATGCGICLGYERLAEPDTQYYYVNQGPTYTGPGAFALYPTYHESAVSSWGGYRWHPHHPRFFPRYGYAPHMHHAMRYGYLPHHYYYGHPVLRRYY